MDRNRKKTVLAIKSQFKDGSYKNNHFVRLLGRTRKKLYGRTSVCAPLVTAPIKIAIFFPGRRLTAVRSEITSVIGVNIHNLLKLLSF